MVKRKKLPPEPAKGASPEELSEYYEKHLDEVELQELKPDELKAESKALDNALENFKKERYQLNLSLSRDLITELKKVAKQKGAPVSTLVRMWIIEKLHPEKA